MRLGRHSNFHALAAERDECNLCRLRADVAQLVEQRFRKP